MAYPPGIPVLIPGEIITSDVLSTISFYLKEDLVILADSEDGYIKVIDQNRWKLMEDYEERIDI